MTMAFMMLENVKKNLLLILIFLSGPLSASPDDNVPYIVYAKEIMNTFISKSEKEYTLECIGTGGKFSKNVAGITIKFVAYRKGTLEEARLLEVTMIEALLSRINTDEKIRPFLNAYPFNINDIKISIAFHKKDNSCYSDGSVVYVSHIKNKLFYYSEKPKTEDLILIMEEPYEQAYKIIFPSLNQSHNDCLPH